MANTPTAALGAARRRIRRAITAIVICCILAAALITTIYVFHAPQVVQAAVAVVAAGLGAFVLYRAFPAGVTAIATAIAATVAVVGLILLPPQTVVRIVQWPIPIVPRLTNPKIVYAPPVKCPNTLNPMALVQTEYQVPNSHPISTGGLGTAHIDNVIAPDGSANVRKFETVCLTVKKYPAADRQLWLILRLREPGENGTFYNLYFVVSALSDPFAGRYSVAVDRSCSSLSKCDRHTLFVISAPTGAATGLWQNYNAWLHSLNTDCNTKADIDRHRLPSGYHIVSEQGDVIQS
jgi:hypothetical protein